MINVTKTFLPDFETYINTVRRAWDKSWITNNGELVQELEEKLKDCLGVKHLFFTSNGTIVLQMALKALGITKEVITTPFSYVATTNAILWEGCQPVFADINEQDFCINPDTIEAAVTENTQAILATHVYGLPCNIEKISRIAERYQLKVIYDGAHAFGCEYNGRSLLGYGDISTCSFHATKIFHTVEGGCIITEDDAIATKLMLYRQFGHVNDDYRDIGINAKNSEFHAAMGICMLGEFPAIIAARKSVFALYDTALRDMPLVRPFCSSDDFVYNYSYYPVVFETEELLKETMAALSSNNIHTRRYFYPSLNTLPFLQKQYCPLSEDIASRVLCLPLFVGLRAEEIGKIASILSTVLAKQKSDPC